MSDAGPAPRHGDEAGGRGEAAGGRRDRSPTGGSGRAPGEAPDAFVVGHVTKAHGIRGDLYIAALTDRPEQVYAPGRTVHVGDERGELVAGARTLTIERARPYKRGWLVTFGELSDRTAAERLTGRYLLVPAEEVEPAEEGELFYHQLLEMEVVTVDGERVGRVREVYETEPMHLLDVSRNGRSHLIPLAEQIVRQVDVDARRIVIDPPPGLLDL